MFVKQRVWVAFLAGQLVACHSGAPATATIRVEGSDTLVNVAQAWAETYCRLNPGVRVQVLGGGSGVGIASLLEGTCDLANSSRELEESERLRAQELRGEAPTEHVIGFDALAVLVHPSNPMRSIRLVDLAEVFGQDGKISQWSQLGVTVPGARSQKIVRVSPAFQPGPPAYDSDRDP